MKTDITQYEASHGKKPRGDGFWFFKLLGTDGDGSYTTDVRSENGKFGEAKARAISSFKREVGGVKEVVGVVVLP